MKEKMKVVVIEKGKWIGGIPDKLIGPCVICGCRVDFDYKVDDSFWERISPPNYKRDVICLRCLDIIATTKGENVCNYIESVFYTGEGKTMELLGDILYLYDKSKETGGEKV